MPFPKIHISQPPRLFPGDAIGVVAPASPFDQGKFIKGLTVLEEMGLGPIVPETIYDRNGYLAGSDSHRADMLNAMFADPAVKGIICARGGYGSLRILSRIDYGAISANPKVFIGCSDITALLNTFFVKCGLVSLHGPMIESLAAASEKTKQSLQDVLFANSVLSVVPENPRTVYAGQASGVIAGGNLTTLCHLVGTPFEPDFSGRMLLLEDVGESPYHIDRMLTQMKMAGCFERVAGILLGSFKGCGDPEQVDAVFADVFRTEAIPILAGFNFGHDEPNLTLPLGLPASFDSAVGALQYAQSPFL